MINTANVFNHGLGSVPQFVSGTALAAGEVIKPAASAVRLTSSTPQNQLRDRAEAAIVKRRFRFLLWILFSGVESMAAGLAIIETRPSPAATASDPPVNGRVMAITAVPTR